MLWSSKSFSTVPYSLLYVKKIKCQLKFETHFFKHNFCLENTPRERDSLIIASRSNTICATSSSSNDLDKEIYGSMSNKVTSHRRPFRARWNGGFLVTDISLRPVDPEVPTSQYFWQNWYIYECNVLPLYHSLPESVNQYFCLRSCLFKYIALLLTWYLIYFCKNTPISK